MDPDQINFIWIRICAILSGSESFFPLGLPDVQFSSPPDAFQPLKLYTFTFVRFGSMSFYGFESR